MPVPESSKSESTEQRHSPEEVSPNGRAAEAVPEVAPKAAPNFVECPSCGRTFSGTYCPDCGEEVGRSLTIGDMAGDAFQEVSQIGNGLLATLVGLTVRPGEVLREYLSGVRKQYMSPGRYLVVSVVLFLGVTQGLIWLGLEKPFADSVVSAGQSSGLAEEASRLTESRWSGLAMVFMNAGILGLLFRRIFGEKLRRGGEALAVGVFLVAHASVLAVGIRLLSVPSVFLWQGAAVDSAVPAGVSSLFMVLYPGVAAYRGFGTSWKSALKSMLGSVWASIETIGIFSITAFWYFFLTAPGLTAPNLSEALSGEEAGRALAAVGAITVVYLLPLFLHAGMEAHYRLRSQ